MKRRILLAVTLAFGALAGDARAFVVDGSLTADWGITPVDNFTGRTPSDWSPSVVLAGQFLEDTSDTAGDGGYVGPEYGGQNYDAEWGGVAYDPDSVYIGIVSGQRPDNGLARYSPGDIRITTASGNVYGIEVGGGAGGGSGTLITEGAPGTTYILTSEGFTQSVQNAAAAQVAGSVWLNPSWINDPIPPPLPTQMQITGGTYVGLADYAFTRNTVTSSHSIIELAIDRAFFGSDTITGVYWRESCGNDEMNIAVTILPVPETGLMVRWALGLSALLLLWFRFAR